MVCGVVVQHLRVSNISICDVVIESKIHTLERDNYLLHSSRDVHLAWEICWKPNA